MSVQIRLSTVFVLLLACLGSAALPSGAVAQVTNADDLQYPPLPAFDVPQPTRVELDNGMVVLLLEDHELPLVEATALIHTGSRLEPADKVGLAELTGDVLRSGGTENRTGDELDLFLESKAASIETSIDTDVGVASMNTLSKDFPEVLAAFADVLRHPVFSQDKIDVAKTSIEAGIARQNDNPQQIVFRELAERVYGEDSPYAANPTYETLGNVERDDLVAWHDEYFHPNRIVLGLVGDFETDVALEQIEKAFGDWSAGPAYEPPEVPYRTEPNPGVFFAEKNDINQSNIALGHFGIRRDNPDYHAVEVMNQIFSGGFASRLFSRVRSDQGLAYAVFGQVGSDWDREGLTLLFTTTKTETTGAAIEALLRETRNMVDEPPTEDEVKKAKQAILSSFVFNSDSTDKILRQQLTYEYFGYPLDWLSRYQKGIEAVTPAQVRQAAEKHLHPDRFSIVVVGPSEGQDKPLSTFGEVTNLDISIPEPEEARAEATEEGMSKAKELLAGAVDALGGSEALDALENFEIAGEVVQNTPQGEMSVNLKTTYLFPGRYRQEMATPMGSMQVVVTPDVGFVTTPQGAQDLPDSRAQQMSARFRRSPLPLLKARNETGFEATALGPEEVGDQTLEMVQVDYDGELSTLGIDPETGRLMLVRFQGPGPGGAPGQVDNFYSDYREIEGGMSYPFSAKTTFNGEPAASLQIEEVRSDQDVDPALFEKPVM